MNLILNISPLARQNKKIHELFRPAGKRKGRTKKDPEKIRFFFARQT